MTEDEKPINGDSEGFAAGGEAPTEVSRSDVSGPAPGPAAGGGFGAALRDRVPEPLEGVVFAVQQRLIWPVEDRFATLAPGPRRAFAGGVLAVLASGAIAAILLLSSGGGGSRTTTSIEASAPRQPLAAPAEAPPKAKPAKPAPTLHGATPVFTPAPKSKGGSKVGGSKEIASAPEESAAASGVPSSPATDRISSDPKSSKPAAAADAARAAVPGVVPDGPPAGPEALKVAREFAKGFVVYETGGEQDVFRPAFKASATPELTKALLKRPPRQPAGVTVPKAKVLNVVAGPSQGRVYKVSVSLLRVGVTSELRLDMEKLKNAEWRVTNVLG